MGCSLQMYTAGNPVILTDPDGKDMDWVETTDDKGNRIIKWDENAKKVDGKVVGLNAGFYIKTKKNVYLLI